MKINTLVVAILVLSSHILFCQVQNSNFQDFTFACPPLGWTKHGQFTCRSQFILPSWGTNYNLPPSVVVPNAQPEDRYYAMIENSIGQYVGWSQTVSPLNIGDNYCLEFTAAVNRNFIPNASLSAIIEIDDIIQDSHTFIYGDPVVPVSLCFTATAQSHEISLRPRLNSGLTTYLIILENSGSFVALNNCSSNETVAPSPIPTGLYTASQTINSSDLVGPTQDVVFAGGNSVELNPGFCIPVTSEFEAIIQDCQ